MKERSRRYCANETPEWRKDIQNIIDSDPQEYIHVGTGGGLDANKHYFPLRNVVKISKPLNEPLALVEGKHDFVVLPPKRLIRETPLVIIANEEEGKKGLGHGDLANKRNVWGAGEIDVDEGVLTRGSGHYLPFPESLDVVQNILVAYKVPGAADFDKKGF